MNLTIPKKPVGIFAYISPTEKGRPPKGFEKVLSKRNIIYIGANDSGNEVDPPWRVALAANAVRILNEAYQIDPDRVYISGFSGGGRSASIGMLGFQDVFSGGMPMAGANAMLPMENATSETDVYFDSGVKGVKPSDLQLAATMGRYVFYSSEKDFNRMNTKKIAEGYQKHGFKFVTYLEAPKRGHNAASAAYLDKALDFLDAPIGEIAISRMKSATKLARSQPALAARQFKSIVMHADTEEKAKEIEKAEKSLAKIMDNYSTDLKKLQAKLEKASDKAKARLVTKFAGKWLQIGASDVAQMQEQMAEASE